MRLGELSRIAAKRRLDEVVVIDEANLRALTGINCDNAILTQSAFYTDFRYAAAVRRQEPELKVRDIKRFALSGRRIGFESSLSKSRFDRLVKLAPRGAKFVDIAEDLARLRSVKTADEIAALKAAQKLNREIFNLATRQFRARMTEREMARIIRKLMIERGDGEAFSTIVCVGKNAAECHHEPDDTVWNGSDGVLIDMGVKLNGYCSDLTRCLNPRRRSAAYRRVEALVTEAHDAALAAAKPGMTAAALDRVAREIIRKGGFGKAFGHSLGHGVGLEIHEAPTISKKSRQFKLKPGMIFTIEPGVYLEGNLGYRYEDMVLLTEHGAEVLE